MGGKLTVDGRLVITLEERRDTRYRALRLQSYSYHMPAPLGFDESKRFSPDCGILPTPDAVETAFVLCPRRVGDHDLCLDIDGFAASALGDEFDSGGLFEWHGEIAIAGIAGSSDHDRLSRRLPPGSSEEISRRGINRRLLVAVPVSSKNDCTVLARDSSSRAYPQTNNSATLACLEQSCGPASF